MDYISQVPIFAGLAYDAVMIFAEAVTKAMKDDKDYRNGTLIIEYIKNLQYQSEYPLYKICPQLIT